MNTVNDILTRYSMMLLFAAISTALVLHYTAEREWVALALAAFTTAAAFVCGHDGTLMLIRRIKKRKEKKDE